MHLCVFVKPTRQLKDIMSKYKYTVSVELARMTGDNNKHSKRHKVFDSQ